MAKSPKPIDGDTAVIDAPPLSIAPQDVPIPPEQQAQVEQDAAASGLPVPAAVMEVPLQLEPGKDYAIPKPRGLFQLWHLKFRHFETNQVRDLYCPATPQFGDAGQVAPRAALAERDPYDEKMPAVEGLVSQRYEFYPEAERDRILLRQRRPQWALGKEGVPMGGVSYKFGPFDPQREAHEQRELAMAMAAGRVAR